MKKRKSNGMRKYLVIAIAIFLGIFWIANINAKSADETVKRYSEKQYQQFEKEFLKQIKEELKACGYENSGVTMTRVSLEHGVRDYQIQIYNRLLDGREDRQDEVTKAILSLNFGDEECDFTIQYISMIE